jgi:hypothetical protein
LYLSLFKAIHLETTLDPGRTRLIDNIFGFCLVFWWHFARQVLYLPSKWLTQSLSHSASPVLGWIFSREDLVNSLPGAGFQL